MDKHSKIESGSCFVQLQWRNRVAAEYASSAIAAQLLHWLIQIGTSPDLLFQCQEVVREELMHTELSREVYIAAGGAEKAIAVNPSHLVIPHGPDRELLYRAMEFTADFFCCGETVAAPLFQRMTEKAQVSIAKNSLLRIVKDEKDHGEFGWELLDHLLCIGLPEHRENLKRRVPDFINRIISTYNTDAELVSNDERWGLISGQEHVEIARSTAEKILYPSFKSLLG